MADPDFSIIVLNYNYAAYLPQAVDSALGQSHAGCEVIVVDDASTDQSRHVIERYGSRIVRVLRDQNGGMSAGANSGFAHARGRLVMFLDADDYLYPHAATQMLDAAADGVAQVQARLHLVDEAGAILDVFPPCEMTLDDGDVTPALCARGRYATSVTSGLAFARTALEAVMPIPERAFDRSADGYLAAVVPFHGRVATIETPIGAYRRHANNHSGFGANLAKRARWATDHDEQRYAAISTQASRRGLRVTPLPGLGDALHLEQRLVSLAFDRVQHAYPSDRRYRLALKGARAAFTGPLSRKRKWVHAALFLVTGFAPEAVAKRALAWKLEQSSRPKFVRSLARRLRRVLG